ncbi:MAG: ACP S-malonyltransferase [Woeseiaceae bacterium]|nr:ACP S-malonyltransferase [Woeseiaceae bacterium]
MTTMFIFPGQGSQYQGMGKDIYDSYDVAKQVYDRASKVLGFDIVDLSFNDPNDELNLTRFTQPALLTHHIACLEVFKSLGGDGQPGMAAGHSLGEYSALVAAGVLEFETALRLVQKRGELMGAHGEGEMTAFPIDLETIRPIAEAYHCAVAGYNLPEQTVVGGRAEDLEKVEAYAAEHFPRKPATRLKTEGAFHTYYMVAAAIYFRAMLDDAEFTPTEIGVLSNFSGGFHYRDAASMRARLFFQLFHPVRWFNNLETAFEAGVEKVIEFGGGIGKGDAESKRPNLQGMIKRATRATGHKLEYVAAINKATIEASLG